MLLDTIFSISLCAAGVVFAAHSLPSERKAAMQCSFAILVGCLAYNAAWFPPYPQLMLGVRSTAYFSIVSALVAIYCLEKSLGKWWDLPLLYLFILDLCCHIARAFNGVEYYHYSVAVDVIGYLQIFIFVCIGGNGVRNRFNRVRGNIRNVFNSHKAVSQREGQA